MFLLASTRFWGLWASLGLWRPPSQLHLLAASLSGSPVSYEDTGIGFGPPSSRMTSSQLLH